ncbi:MAG: alkane 1-monooxygenase [Saprospiraceae bacterium]|nr:alkane 1-monooxygenase [Saprospiraceae bacterium]
MKDLKYLLAYVIPLTCILGLILGGIWSFSTAIFGFILIPLFELVTPNLTDNLDPHQEDSKAKAVLFDIMLYLNLPIVYGLLGYYFYTISQTELATYEIVGITSGIGILLGTNGINVAHELGHRDTKFEQFLSKALLLPEFYMHFFIEHNRGHHRRVATPEDPATSRYGEILYTFWFRTVIGSYLSAWRLEIQRLKQENQSFWSWHNEMLMYQIIQISYVLILGFSFSWTIVLFAFMVGIIGFLLLETINYVEHYGLMREQKASGRYEPVNMCHSWNSDQILGRIMLYELTRHSDHHYKANRKYQVLRHFEESPQLPMGYPSLVLLALVPPLWFWVMNPRVEYYRKDRVSPKVLAAH